MADPRAEYKVHKITTCGLAERDDEARALLERVAWQVTPLLRRHEWRVGELTELPGKLLHSRGGDNYNRGQRIRLALRRPGAPPGAPLVRYETVLRVMLHEITHCKFGPHSAAFYDLLAQLEKECEELERKGVGGTGAGFDAPSAGVVGGRSVDAVDVKRAAAAAAERRGRVQSLMGSGKLGGAPAGEGVSPAVAAARAAEKRAGLERQAREFMLLDDVVDDGEDAAAPASGGAAADDGVVRIELSDSEDDAPAVDSSGLRAVDGVGVRVSANAVECPCCRTALASEDEDAARRHLAECQASRRRNGAGKRPAPPPQPKPQPPKPPPQRKPPPKPPRDEPDVVILDDSDDDDDGAAPVPPPAKRRVPGASTWTCGACTFAGNAESASNCSVCETWRFSNGAPVAASTGRLGT